MAALNAKADYDRSRARELPASLAKQSGGYLSKLKFSKNVSCCKCGNREEANNTPHMLPMIDQVAFNPPAASDRSARTEGALKGDSVPCICVREYLMKFEICMKLFFFVRVEWRSLPTVSTAATHHQGFQNYSHYFLTRNAILKQSSGWVTSKCMVEHRL
jgi:hypothetical protein